MKVMTTMVEIAGRPIGTSTRHSVVQLFAPSIRAASITARALPRKYVRIQNTPNASDWAVCGRINAQ